jgi:hypothetical protein
VVLIGLVIYVNAKRLKTTDEVQNVFGLQWDCWAFWGLKAFICTRIKCTTNHNPIKILVTEFIDNLVIWCAYLMFMRISFHSRWHHLSFGVMWIIQWNMECSNMTKVIKLPIILSSFQCMFVPYQASHFW